MPETLLSSSTILLYGRQLLDLEIVESPSAARLKDAPLATEYEETEGESGSSAEESEEETGPPHALPPPMPQLGENRFLSNQLELTDARLARIYAFAFEGHYYDLPRPAIFLVHGPGSDPEALRPSPALPFARVSRAPADADLTGVANSPSSFSEDVRVWAYDKDDISLRLDPYSGTLEQILLERCLGGPGAYGAALHGAGAYGAALSGAGAFGAGAYGAALSGAGAFGAGAFGAGAFGRGRRGGD